MFQPFRVDSQSFYESLILPQFADLTPQGTFRGSLGEFTIMDGVSSSRPIIGIRGTQNILQRRDASCNIIYKKVLGTDIRSISTTEVYGATQQCANEFYQGCLKDWRNNDPLFGDRILPYFLKAINSDLASNAYFGDKNRVSSPDAAWSTNIYDGVFKWLKFYIANNIIPSNQTLQIADGTDYTASPASAYNLLKSMYERQNILMRSWAVEDKVYYVNQEIADGYIDYLTSVGLQAQGYTLITNGIKQLAYKNIPIIVEPLWSPILFELKGSTAHAAILTIKGNFVFATDSKYGEGEDLNTALEVWYNQEKMTWFYRYWAKAGTQIALPEHTIVAVTLFN